MNSRFNCIKVSIFKDICKNRLFSYIPYCFLYKNRTKQKGRPLGVSPKLPSLENLDITFSHSIRSSTKRSSETYLFDIKVTRYRCCASDRLLAFQITTARRIYQPFLVDFFINTLTLNFKSGHSPMANI